MAATREVPITGAWRDIATAGDVALGPWTSCLWAVTDGTSPPAFEFGHIATQHKPVDLLLEGSERLWVKTSGGPSGTVYVTADAPVG